MILRSVSAIYRSDNDPHERCHSRRNPCYRSMMYDIDIWHSANILMKQHGPDEAPKIAAKRADAFRVQGDLEGFAVWVQIVLAIMTLERRGMRENEAVN